MTHIPSFGDNSVRRGGHGGNWSHIKSNTNYGGGTLLFIDGTIFYFYLAF